MIIFKFKPQKSSWNTYIKLSDKKFSYSTSILDAELFDNSQSEWIDLESFEEGSTAESEYVTIDTDIEGNNTISVLWFYKDNIPENMFPADLINPSNGLIKPLESTNGI